MSAFCMVLLSPKNIVEIFRVLWAVDNLHDKPVTSQKLQRGNNSSVLINVGRYVKLYRPTALPSLPWAVAGA